MWVISNLDEMTSREIDVFYVILNFLMSKSDKSFEPVYKDTFRRGLLEGKIEAAFRLLESCTLCPRQCRVNRLKEKTGYCRAGLQPEISSYAPHFGEEQPLVGRGGSGTIFLTHCSLRCSFCQNYSISHLGDGE